MAVRGTIFRIKLVKDESGKIIAVGKNKAAVSGEKAEIEFYVADGNGNATAEPFKLTYTKEGIHHY